MNVIIGLCRSFNGKVGTFQESLMLVTKAFVDVPSTSSGFYWQLPDRQGWVTARLTPIKDSWKVPALLGQLHLSYDNSAAFYSQI